MNNKSNKIKDIVRTILVGVLLAAITFATMELQKHYYTSSDEKMLQQVTIEDYSMSVMNSEMTLKQKIEAMVDDDSIISEESRQFDTETVDKLNKLLVEQIEDVLDYGWETTLVDIINDNQTEKNWGSMKIVRVIDDQIYSFELGVLTFRSDVYDMFYEPALVFFDYSTGKILYLALYFDYNVDYIGYDEFNNPSYIDALSQYYDMYINPENCDAFVAENAIWISPYTNEEILSNNFDDFYNYAYKIMDY